MSDEINIELPDLVSVKREKHCYLGTPAIFLLDRECRLLNEAFGNGHHCCYLVGSVLERPDFRDVDLRVILRDNDFNGLFPTAGKNWQHDQRWLIINSSISEHLSRIIGREVDFQIQPLSMANRDHNGPRLPIGMKFVFTPLDE